MTLRERLARVFGPRVPRERLAADRARFLAPTLLLTSAAALLVVSIFLPYWHMKLLAPQYPKGLTVDAYLDRLEGDVREIDGLNHYIGMRPLGEAATLERAWSVTAIAAIVTLVLAAIFIHNRKAAWLSLPALCFPVVFLADLHFWLRSFGTNLDPRAPLSSSIKPFVPPVLGRGTVGQFATVATPGPGLILATVAAIAIVAGLWYHRRAYKPLVEKMAKGGRGAAVTALLVAAGAALAGGQARAAEIGVTPQGPVKTLAEALAAAGDGDVVRVEGGVHAGGLVIERGVHLIGVGWPVVDGGGRGSVITVRSAGTTIEGFEIRGSGELLDEENTGIAVEAPAVTVRGNRLEDVLFGVYLREAPDSRVVGNAIRGKDLPLARRGDAIRVWYSDGVEIADNDVEAGRDVVLWYSNRLAVRGNRVREGRYGLHFMYCDDAAIQGNLLYGNSVGAFLMYSRRLRLTDNAIARNHGPSGYGVGLKDMDDALVAGNLFVGNRVGAFLDNSPREIRSTSRLSGNAFAGNDVGVLLMPNVRRAEIVGNGFVENGEQVGLAGAGGDPEANVWLENHWSDYAGYDLDGDGFGELPYRAERLFEGLADRHPELRIFLHGPATRALDFAAVAFPIVRPRPKLTDPRPRMAPIAPVAASAAPALPRRPGGAWTPAAGGMVAGAIALLAFPWLLRREARLLPRRRRRAAGGAAAAGRRPVEAVVEAAGLTVRYGSKAALEGVDFAIAGGESVALWGPNGAGKTTALRAILGVVAVEGSVRVAGLDPRRRGREVRKRLGFVPQAIAFQADLGAYQTLEFFARLRGAPAERLGELVAWLGLEEHADKPVGALSGGLKQRLALAAALVDDPPVLLLDEPTANLDAAARESFYRKLLELRAAGKTLLFTSHRFEEVSLLADRVLHLAAGRLVADGPPESIERSGANGAGRVEIALRVEEARLAEAEGILAADGFAPRRLGPCLVVVVAADRKIGPLASLLRRGLEPQSFELSERSGSGNGRHAAS